MSTWLTGTLGCQGLGTVCQLWCSGLGKGKMRRGGDDVEEEEEEEIMLVGGGDSKKRSTQARRSRPPTAVGMRLMIPPKGQPKRPRTAPPSICFTPK